MSNSGYRLRNAHLTANTTNSTTNTTSNSTTNTTSNTTSNSTSNTTSNSTSNTTSNSTSNSTNNGTVDCTDPTQCAASNPAPVSTPNGVKVLLNPLNSVQFITGLLVGAQLTGSNETLSVCSNTLSEGIVNNAIIAK